MAVPDQDPRNLHDLAVDIQTDLQKLATGLAHAGAAPPAVSELTRMAEVISGVTKELAAGPQLDAGSPQQPQHPGAPPQGAPAAPPQPAPAGPPQAAPAPAQSPEQQAAHHSMHAAVSGLKAAMVANKTSQPQ
jgi:hypothetical protein